MSNTIPARSRRHCICDNLNCENRNYVVWWIQERKSRDDRNHRRGRPFASRPFFHSAARPCHGRKCPDARPGPRKKFSKIEKQFPQGRGDRKNFQKSKNNSLKEREAEKIFKNRKTIPVLLRRDVPVMFLYRMENRSEIILYQTEDGRTHIRTLLQDGK
jgi:hypothetical protein